MGDLIGKSVKRVEDNRFIKGEGNIQEKRMVTDNVILRYKLQKF